MDGTLLTIVLLLFFATVLALIQARRRDRCLKGFEHFHITLSEKDGDLTWGRVEVYTSGLEITYDEPVVAREGHLERSFIFYKDQYDTMDALYRYPGGLSEEEKARRKAIIERTARPGFFRKLGRKLRNWISMVRDALLQAISMVIGAAKTAKPGATVLSSHEQQLKAISGEVIGHAGNAFDPLLEKHLFRQVVLEVTLGEETRSYCGWLRDYTSQFIEVVDAYANPAEVRMPPQVCTPGDGALPNVSIRVADRRVYVENESNHVLNVRSIEGNGFERAIGCVLPPGYTADWTLPPGADEERVCVQMGAVERVDMVVPRAHAIVRHAADGSEKRSAPSAESVMADGGAVPTDTEEKASV